MVKLCRPDIQTFAALCAFSLVGILLFAVWTTEVGYNDGTRIDLSRRHQAQLIDDFMHEYEQLRRENGPDLDEADRRRSFHGDAVGRRVRLDVEDDGEYVDDGERRLPVAASRTTKRIKTRNYYKNYDKPKLKPTQTPVDEPGRNKNGSSLVGNVLGDLRGGPAMCSIYDTRPVVEEDFECIVLRIKPSTHVCLHPTDIDVHVSLHLRGDGLWEPHIVRTFQNLLYQDPQLGVYDIGANIGQYTLLAAAMGRKVVAVEPYLPNLRRLHKGIKMGKVEDKVYQ